MRTKFYFLLILIFTTPLLFADSLIPPEEVAATKELLKNLVAIDTTNPPGNELKIAEFVKEYLKGVEGLETKLFQSAPGRANLIVRLKGNGKKKPLMIMAHTDVVGADKKDWETDPFQMTEKEGYLYGRGVLDDKGMAAVGITVMKLLAKNKVALDRDVILFLGADEESGSTYGILWVLEQMPDQVTAEVALNEGGTILIENNKITQAAVQNYEKILMNVSVTTEGDSGHSSVPSRNNAVIRLAQAISKIGAHEFPVQLNEVTRAYFEGLSKVKDHPLREEFDALVSPKKGKSYIKAVEKISENPDYNARLRTTCTPTIMNAGFRSTAIPGKAEATINCRILPTEDPEQVLAKLREVIGDPQVVLERRPNEEKGAMSPIDNPFFDAVKKVMKEMVPEAVTVPYMSAGATDSRKLRYRGLNAYGLYPFPITAEDASRMHGNNERMPVASLPFGIEFLYRLVVEFSRPSSG